MELLMGLITIALLVVMLTGTTANVAANVTPTVIEKIQKQPLDYPLPKESWKIPAASKHLNYSEYILSDAWYENPQRKLRLHEANYSCELCDSVDKIQVHHITYDSLGKESKKDLVVLCEECHTHTHEVAGNGAKLYPPVRRLNG